MAVDRVLLGRLRVEPLDRKKHDRAAFSCGEPKIDNYLKTQAAGLQDLDTARICVACLDDSKEIIGFYAMSSHEIDVQSLPADICRRLPKYPRVGAVYLSVAGVITAYQGSGIGSFLMADAFKKAVRVADQIGTAFIVLDALNGDAARLYRRLGFVDLEGQEPRMLIGMKAVREAVARV